MIFWNGLTHFGDISVTALIALAIVGWLLAENEKRLALWWSVLFGGGLALVVVTKMAFIGWGLGISSLDFTGFSGHAMRSAAVMPVLFYLLLQRAPRAARAVAALLGLTFATLIGISRLVLQVHSTSEVVTGWLLGASVAFAFLMVANNTLRRHTFKPLRSALILLALLPAPYVHPTPTQKWLTKFTLYVAGQEQTRPESAEASPAHFPTH